MNLNTRTLKLVYSALFLTLALTLPLLTGQLHSLGNALLPMHLPVMLCGFLCGWQYGLIVGFLSPILRSVLFGMPVIFPMGISMAFELATYGSLCGLIFKRSDKGIASIYLALLISMISGRIVWGFFRYIFSGLYGSAFTLSLFWSSGFIEAIPGIIIQLILIPIIVKSLNHTSLSLNEKR